MANGSARREASDDDLLYGLGQIAKHLSSKLTYRQLQHLHQKRLLPTFALGQMVCARKSVLAQHFAALEAQGRG